MRYLIIIFLLAATGIQAQDTIAADSTHAEYVNDTSHYSRAMTAEELDEYFGEYNQEKKVRGEKIERAINYSVQQHYNQNPQDYTNFYYRKKRRSLMQIIFGG